MKLRRIANALSVIFVAYGVVLLLPALFALVDSEYYETMPFVLAAAISASCGLGCRFYGRRAQDFDQMKRTEGLFIVTLTWIGAVYRHPYLDRCLLCRRAALSFFRALSGGCAV